MNKYTYAFVVLVVLMLSGCATEVHRKVQRDANYAVGKTKVTAVGNAMVMEEYVELLEGRKWVGVLNSPDGWEYFSNPTDDSYRKELLYTGRSGDTIHITYREYKRSFARPAFFQNLTYDLSSSDVIVFQNYKIQVLGATNSEIKFNVLKR